MTIYIEQDEEIERGDVMETHALVSGKTFTTKPGSDLSGNAPKIWVRGMDMFSLD